jgi:hypothetical protein
MICKSEVDRTFSFAIVADILHDKQLTICLLATDIQ